MHGTMTAEPDKPFQIAVIDALLLKGELPRPRLIAYIQKKMNVTLGNRHDARRREFEANVIGAVIKLQNYGCVEADYRVMAGSRALEPVPEYHYRLRTPPVPGAAL